MNKIIIGRRGKDIDSYINIYCGRGSAYGNPYKMNSEADRDFVCNQYEKYFKVEANKVNSKLNIAMHKLLQYLRDGYKLNLQCFCTPKRCHCETIKKSLEKIISK